MEIGPTGKSKSIKDTCKVYEIVVDSQDVSFSQIIGSSSHFFNEKTFNIVVLLEGAL